MKKLSEKIDKKWFENYWYYYKIHTIAGVFILLIVVFSLVECINRVNPDAYVTYMGEMYFGEDFTTGFENEMAEYIQDIDGDGVKKVFLSVLTMPDEIKSEQDFAMQQKAQLELAAGDTFLYLMDEEYFDLYNEQGLFIDLSQELGLGEETYGLLIDESAVLKKLGYQGKSNIYAAVRVLTVGDEKKQKKVGAQNNAVEILKELYKKD